ncbi:GDSL esterase/lipase At2g42990-like [Curcuma longa]|uniref:GDSL esterase/lipase At2g42990-like n=1 Tax=Curcuma longa TaxID=136217 RepID=UPI003D9DB7D9
MAVNLFVLFFLFGCAAGRIPAVIVFGDSTVDPGNNDFLLTPLKANFPPYGRDFPGNIPTGRFCNGRLSTDFISSSLGLPPTVPPYLDPSLPIQRLASGVSFASAGTGLDPATSQLLSVIPLMEEVELFREYKSRLAAHFGAAEAEAIVGEALYLVSIGTNDYIVNYFPMATERSKQFTVWEFGEFLAAGVAEFVAALHALGARKIVFVGLAPIGCLPVERLTGGGGGCSEEHSAAARGFNDRLEAAVARLDGELPGLRLRFAPLYDFVADVIQNPRSYGFENAVQGCCGTGELEVSFLCNKWTPYTCPDANQYAFFDSVHPSEKLNSLLSDYLLNTTLAEFI